MRRGRRPIRGGRSSKLDRGNGKRPKVKKEKFDYHKSPYVRDRLARYAEVDENKKKLLLREERKRKLEEESEEEEEEEEEDALQTLLSSFPNINNRNKVAIESESESEDSDVGEENEEEIEEDGDDSEDDSSSGSDEEEESNKVKKGSNEAEDVNDDDDDDDEIHVNLKEEDEEDQETTREDAGILKDPFAIHLNNDLSNELYAAVSNPKPNFEVTHLLWPHVGKLVVQIPKADGTNHTDKKIKTSLLDDEQFAREGRVPDRIDKVNWDNLYIKSQIQNNLTKANYNNIKDSLDSNPNSLTPLQKELFSVINNYQDLLYCERTFDNESEIRFIYCLHAINHVLKTRTKILHHNAKISKLKKTSMSEIPDEYRDQGLVRPKVLIVVPFRSSCLKIVETLISILIGEDKGGSVMNKIRFFEDFGGDNIHMPQKNPKPEDYELTFKGNTDDTFKIGISITKKTLKLYSEFYSSDIIITSVLGLRLLIGAEGEEDRDYDFLSSIELLIMDQMELFYMQNWDHLIHIFNHLHLQPKNSHDTDFSRVRSWCVNGWSKYYRQTLLFSSINLPEIHAIFNKKCLNYSGKVKIVNPIITGSICQVLVQLPQIFYKFNANNHAEAIDKRFDFFIKKILPQFKNSIMNHTIIVIPSYFDYVKVRNYFKNEDLKCVQICEYSKDGKIARARDMFYHGDIHFLIYSERFHFYRRIRIKGIRHLIFYSPPTFSHFYHEMCNFMHESNQNPRSGSDNNMTVTTLYSKYDAMQLAAIVGTDRATKMITSDKNIHMIVTGE